MKSIYLFNLADYADRTIPLIPDDKLISTCQHEKLHSINPDKTITAYLLKNIAHSTMYFPQIEEYINTIGLEYKTANTILLFAAITKRSFDTVKLLLSHGADPLLYDNFAIKLAINSGYYCKLDILQILAEYGADLRVDNDYLFRLVIKDNRWDNDLDKIKFLLEHHANVHIKNDYAIRHTCWVGNVESAKLLIDFGANVSADNNFPIRISVRYGHMEIIKLLINHGADINAVTSNDVCYLLQHNHNVNTIKILRDYGINFSSVNSLNMKNSWYDLLINEGVDPKQLFLLVKKFNDEDNNDRDPVEEYWKDIKNI